MAAAFEAACIDGDPAAAAPNASVDGAAEAALDEFGEAREGEQQARGCAGGGGGWEAAVGDEVDWMDMSIAAKCRSCEMQDEQNENKERCALTYRRAHRREWNQGRP